MGDIMGKDKYDVIVIGAGIAGLGAGAILSKEAHQKVLVLDNGPKLGGRMMCYDGYPEKGWLLDIGLHLVELGQYAPCTEINERVGKSVVWAPLSETVEMWDGEKFINMSDMINLGNDSKKRFRDLMQKIATMTDIEIERWDFRSLQEWLQENVSDPAIREVFSTMGMLMTTIANPIDMAAGEVLYIARQNLLKARQLVSAGYPIDAMDGITRGLAEAIVENGGEIRLQCDVQEVLIENGKAIGVRIPVKNHPYSPLYRMLETGEIYADRIVCALPIYHLDRILNLTPQTSPLPQWWIQRINSIKNEVTGGVGYLLGLSEPVVDPEKKCFIAALKLRHAQAAFQGFPISNFSKKVAPPGKQLLVVSIVMEHNEARDRFKREKALALMWKDVLEMFPGIEQKIEWRLGSYGDGIDGLARHPGLVGNYKPALTAPGISNLYFAGDTYRGRGLGVNCSAQSGQMCADLIINELNSKS